MGKSQWGARAYDRVIGELNKWWCGRQTEMAASEYYNAVGDVWLIRSDTTISGNYIYAQRGIGVLPPRPGFRVVVLGAVVVVAATMVEG